MIWPIHALGWNILAARIFQPNTWTITMLKALGHVLQIYEKKELNIRTNRQKGQTHQIQQTLRPIWKQFQLYSPRPLSKKWQGMKCSIVLLSWKFKTKASQLKIRVQLYRIQNLYISLPFSNTPLLRGPDILRKGKIGQIPCHFIIMAWSDISMYMYYDMQ